MRVGVLDRQLVVDGVEEVVEAEQRDGGSACEARWDIAGPELTA